MAIEPGEETTRLFRERGWTHWHNLFSTRGLLVMALTKKFIAANGQEQINPFLDLALTRTLDFSSRLSFWENGIGKDLPSKFVHIKNML